MEEFFKDYQNTINAIIALSTFAAVAVSLYNSRKVTYVDCYAYLGIIDKSGMIINLDEKFLDYDKLLVERGTDILICVDVINENNYDIEIKDPFLKFFISSRNFYSNLILDYNGKARKLPIKIAPFSTKLLVQKLNLIPTLSQKPLLLRIFYLFHPQVRLHLNRKKSVKLKLSKSLKKHLKRLTSLRLNPLLQGII